MSNDCVIGNRPRSCAHELGQVDEARIVCESATERGCLSVTWSEKERPHWYVRVVQGADIPKCSKCVTRGTPEGEVLDARRHRAHSETAAMGSTPGKKACRPKDAQAFCFTCGQGRN